MALITRGKRAVALSHPAPLERWPDVWHERPNTPRLTKKDALDAGLRELLRRTKPDERGWRSIAGKSATAEKSFHAFRMPNGEIHIIGPRQQPALPGPVHEGGGKADGVDPIFNFFDAVQAFKSFEDPGGQATRP